ncbi:MAG: CDP-alcohol phosphatidyltransferase family protein [Proteobacteria bacterium]|nr:CDP-alcohol phosphatidyltransferase family protein [Pseudomonadota bacterium]MBU1389966.1 CDP-alcohol phosphatidyltransferase family protein [Pseudomonadota bacterium]MBU1544179.1 CDP-alcohol phosphatidyltransferase family protein [Pseudomonadota bacterium]MBU2430268.1 CDP-alcohol phosphatidyltransferase family protein [Pseudomonadota bacterium]MBU2481153.1 CDP-alcohol phosphatidyltransferase family protein [Pseudomonadota bacterium]
MERVMVISASAAVGTVFFMWFSQAVKKQYMRDYIMSHQWLLHPNSICYWRTVLAGIGFVLYFYTSYQALAIFIFTFAAILDGVDGVVARGCDLVSPLGEWLDPLCDKLTYLPPLIGFAYAGIISIQMVWTLVAIELVGQFFSRWILLRIKFSGAANNFGKIKAIICFCLVIFCALMDKNPDIINIADSVLMSCIVLSGASVVFKFIPHRLYADILSGLNFCCGVASLILTYHRYFAWAICIIIIGQLFDLFDGRMALKHGGTKYGPYLDDIADFVSFGLAPAYVIIQKSYSPFAWFVGAVFIAGVAFRLIRFIARDKGRTDLPAGIFNGLPSPAGALIVLGASLVSAPAVLWAMTGLSVCLMISHIRFAHFGRVILRKIPRPVFFLISAAIIILLAYIFKTKNVQMFGYVILGVVTTYMAVGRKCAAKL